MKSRNILLVIISLACLFSTFFGCANSEKKQNEGLLKKIGFEGKVDEVYVSPDFKKNVPLKVAILPFENLSDVSEAGGIVRRVFFNHFASKKYQDVELYKVDAVLRKHGLYSNQHFNKIDPKDLGDILDVDGLLYGKIITFDSVFGGIFSSVNIELEVKLVKAETGEMLWRSRHKASHHEGSLVLHPIDLIPAVIRASLNVRQIEFLRGTDDLCRTIISSAPDPDIGQVMKAPQITFFAHDSRGIWKKTGDTIHVSMVGESGQLATFNLADIRKGLPMNEEGPGVYSGYYKVMPGDAVTAGIVAGNLVDERGNKSEWIDPLNLVNIDTVPPEKPMKPVAIGRDQSVVLKWPESQNGDVHAYKVYRSKSPKDGYNEITKTQLNQFNDKDLDNEATYYYKIAALDRAENKSSPTDFVSCVPVKPGPTIVSGSIKVDTTWYAGSSPIIISDEVLVMNGSTLTIEPGTLVKSQGAGIVVRGKLLAQGREDNIIQMVGSRDEKNNFIWNGITFDNTNDAESRLEYSKIKHADTAITIISSSPVITHNTIMENGTGILIQEFSKPAIRGNSIINNHRQGVLCERSAPQISENSISENQEGGLLSKNATPTVRYNNFSGNKDFAINNINKAPGLLATMDNWWGSTDIVEISPKIKGIVSYKRILDAPYPEGKPTEILKDYLISIPQLIKKAVGNMQQEKYKEAREILECVVAVQPDNPKARFFLGVLFYQLRKFDEALKNIKIAVELDPKNPGYHYNLGLAYSEKGDMVRAVAEWRKVIELDPDNKRARTLLDMYTKRNGGSPPPAPGEQPLPKY